jgi:hypothetical protein
MPVRVLGAPDRRLNLAVFTNSHASKNTPLAQPLLRWPGLGLWSRGNVDALVHRILIPLKEIKREL